MPPIGPEHPHRTPQAEPESSTWRPAVLVVPCFNERNRLDLSAFDRFALDHDDVGFLFVDDGSTDGTGDMIRAHGRGSGEGLRFLRLDENQGKGEAVRAGLRKALEWAPEVVGFWDADLATPLHEIPPMLKILASEPERQVVLASRVQLLGRQMERKAYRHYLGRVFATGASLTLEMPVYDTQCGAKVFRVAPALRSSLEEPFLARWVFDIELLARYARVLGTDDLRWIEEYPLRRWTDVGGSKLRLLDFFLAVRDLARIWWIRRRARQEN